MSVLEYTARSRKATGADVPVLARVLAQAFLDDPSSDYFFPRLDTRLRGLERMFGLLFLPGVLPHGETYTTPDLAGAALWTPPGAPQPGPIDRLRELLASARVWGRDVRHAARGFAFMDEHHPHEPHYYLPILAVAPDRQGQGIGTALMRPVLERCDREGIPAYLEATSPRNRALYEGHGFRVTREVRWPGGGAPLYLMWRDPIGA